MEPQDSMLEPAAVVEAEPEDDCSCGLLEGDHADLHADALAADEGEAMTLKVAGAGEVQVRRDADAPLGLAAAPRAVGGFVGLTTVAADKVAGGFNNFTLRKDLVDAYRAAFDQVHAMGGILTSSGGIRDLREPATAGRSKTSLHYTGRAIDLFIRTGMQGASDRYLVTRDGGTDANPEWKVWCVMQGENQASPLFDRSLVREGDFEYLVWKSGVGGVKQRRNVRVFSLTDVMARHGWRRIPARAKWKTEYLSVEWWHFQHHKDLVDGVTKFGDDLRRAWASNLVAGSGLALNAVFRGRSFRAV